MLLRNPLFGAYVAEHSQLLFVISTHAFFLSVWRWLGGVVFQHPAISRLAEGQGIPGIGNHTARDGYDYAGRIALNGNRMIWTWKLDLFFLHISVSPCFLIPSPSGAHYQSA